MNDNTYVLERVVLSDAQILLNFAKEQFVVFFEQHNTKENLDFYVNTAFTIEKMKSEINNNFSEFYFAKINTEVIGYLKVNFANAQTEIQDKTSLEIERIYVSKEYQGKKLADLMLAKAIEIAKSKNLNYIWLGVWEKNNPALRFYEKNNFKKFDTHIFKMGDDEQTDFLMKLDIN